MITSPFTFFATAGTIARIGARPVFVDIEPATFNLNPELLERAITPRTKAIKRSISLGKWPRWTA